MEPSGCEMATKMAPKWIQNAPKIQNWTQAGYRKLDQIHCTKYWKNVCQNGRGGVQNGAKMMSNGHQNDTKMDPKCTQDPKLDAGGKIFNRAKS